MSDDDIANLLSSAADFTDDADTPVLAPVPLAELPPASALPLPAAPVADTLPDLPPMPNAADLIDDETPLDKQITKLVEADALHAAGVSVVLGQRLAEMAMVSQDIEEVRKAYTAFTARSDLVEKRRVPSTAQVPLTIIFQRSDADLSSVDVRRGAKMQQLRDAAAAAQDVPA